MPDNATHHLIPSPSGRMKCSYCREVGVSTADPCPSAPGAPAPAAEPAGPRVAGLAALLYRASRAHPTVVRVETPGAETVELSVEDGAGDWIAGPTYSVQSFEWDGPPVSAVLLPSSTVTVL